MPLAALPLTQLGLEWLVSCEEATVFLFAQARSYHQQEPGQRRLVSACRLRHLGCRPLKRTKAICLTLGQPPGQSALLLHDPVLLETPAGEVVQVRHLSMWNGRSGGQRRRLVAAIGDQHHSHWSRGRLASRAPLYYCQLLVALPNCSHSLRQTLWLYGCQMLDLRIQPMADWPARRQTPRESVVAGDPAPWLRLSRILGKCYRPALLRRRLAFAGPSLGR